MLVLLTFFSYAYLHPSSHIYFVYIFFFFIPPLEIFILSPTSPFVFFVSNHDFIYYFYHFVAYTFHFYYTLPTSLDFLIKLMTLIELWSLHLTIAYYFNCLDFLAILIIYLTHIVYINTSHFRAYPLYYLNFSYYISLELSLHPRASCLPSYISRCHSFILVLGKLCLHIILELTILYPYIWVIINSLFVPYTSMVASLYLGVPWLI